MTNIPRQIPPNWGPLLATNPLVLSNIPAAHTPHNPHAPWILTEFNGSSISNLFNNLENVNYINAPTAPIKIDTEGNTCEHPAGIDTNPANIPFDIPIILCTLSIKKINTPAIKPPPAADNVVVKHIYGIMNESLLYIESNIPLLNPYHPTHNNKVPNATNPKLFDLNSNSWRSEVLCLNFYPTITSSSCVLICSNLLILGPTIIVPINPKNPADICTTPDPAKSYYF